LADPSGHGFVDTGALYLSAIEQSAVAAGMIGLTFLYTLTRVPDVVGVPEWTWPNFPDFSPDGPDPNKKPEPPRLSDIYKAIFGLIVVSLLGNAISGGIQPIVEGEPQPVQPPEPESSTQPNPDLVYREGRDRPRTMRLYRPQDWQTGMSFWSQPPGAPYLTYRVKVLTANGFMLRFDQAGPLFRLPFFGGGVYMDPSTGQALPVIAGHVSVYHINQEYWTQWYNDEQAYTGSAGVSWQTTALYELREPVP